jgi:hypothetical protein
LKKLISISVLIKKPEVTGSKDSILKKKMSWLLLNNSIDGIKKIILILPIICSLEKLT